MTLFVVVVIAGRKTGTEKLGKIWKQKLFFCDEIWEALCNLMRENRALLLW